LKLGRKRGRKNLEQGGKKGKKEIIIYTCSPLFVRRGGDSKLLAEEKAKRGLALYLSLSRAVTVTKGKEGMNVP